MNKYRMYVDEVGNSDMGSSDNPNHRFLSLTGVIVSMDHVSDILHTELEAIKQRYFGAHPDEPIVFHRKELMNAKYPFQALKQLQTRIGFDRELLDCIQRWDYVVITVCLDKQKHKNIYSTWRYDPYHYCLAILLERYYLWLNRHHCSGDVMAESRGGKEDIRLKESFHRLWIQGTEYVKPEKFQRALSSGQLKVKPKAANVSGLQLADLLAHPSRAEILDEQHLLGRPLAKFSKQVIAILQNKYDIDEQKGIIFGKKFL